MKERSGKKAISIFNRFLLLTAVLTAATVIGFVFRRVNFPETNLVVIYLLAVLIISWITNGFIYGILASVIATFAYNYFFTAPYYTFIVHDPSYIITFSVMLITALITSTLTSHIKEITHVSLEREAQTKAVFELTNRLTDAKDLTEIKEIALSVISYNFSCEAEFIEIDDRQMPDISFIRQKPDKRLGQKGMRPVQPYSFVRLQSGTYADDEYWPIIGRESVLGIIHISKERSLNLDEAQTQLLCSMMESIALAMDRFLTAEQNMKTREAASRERYRGNLLRAISHDLRTPLSGIIGTSEMLMAMTEKQDALFALVKGINKDAEWLHALVENILSLTRLQDGLALEKKLEAVEEVVGEAVNRVQKHFSEHEINVSVPKELLLVPMDARLIEQVLINLLDNAIKHTASGEEISVFVETIDKTVKFSVQDSGVGIDRDDLPHIFEMFYTTDKTHSDARQGIGLGLAICDGIIKAHGGSITVKNRTDRTGAVFTFTLPLEE